MKTNFYPMTIAIITCLVLSLGGSVTALQKKLAAGSQPMNDQKMKELFSKPIDGSYYSIKRGETMSLQYSPDGKQKIIAPRITDEGKYRIVNGELCSKWNVIRNGAEG